MFPKQSQAIFVTLTKRCEIHKSFYDRFVTNIMLIFDVPSDFWYKVFGCCCLYSGPVISGRVSSWFHTDRDVSSSQVHCNLSRRALLGRVLLRENQMWLIGDLGLSYCHLCPHATHSRGQTWPPTGRLLFVSLCNTFPEFNTLPFTRELPVVRHPSVCLIKAAVAVTPLYTHLSPEV